LATLSALLPACVGKGTLAPDAGGQTPDAGGQTPDAGEQTLDGGKCVGDLANIGAGCPRTFDGSAANLPACLSAGPAAQQTVWRCQDLIVFMDSDGHVASTCYYDATSHALVGAEKGSDAGSYCGQTSLTIEAGRTNSMCRENAPTLQRPCRPPDGGNDGSGPAPDASDAARDMASDQSAADAAPPDSGRLDGGSADGGPADASQADAGPFVCSGLVMCAANQLCVPPCCGPCIALADGGSCPASGRACSFGDGRAGCMACSAAYCTATVPFDCSPGAIDPRALYCRCG
jgi:hypothetical protein